MGTNRAEQELSGNSNPDVHAADETNREFLGTVQEFSYPRPYNLGLEVRFLSMDPNVFVTAIRNPDGNSSSKGTVGLKKEAANVSLQAVKSVLLDTHPEVAQLSVGSHSVERNDQGEMVAHVVLGTESHRWDSKVSVKPARDDRYGERAREVALAQAVVDGVQFGGALLLQ